MTMPRSLRRQRGSETVEFAISATLLFLLLFGIIEFSVALFDKATLTNASREGARTGILFRPDTRPDFATYDLQCDTVAANSENEAIRSAVCDYAEQFLISLGGPADMAIQVQRSDLNANGVFDAGDDLVVNVNYPYQYLILPGFIDALEGVLDLSSTIVMRAE
ncbi:TadE/TadG family type IV pilus assembly protein [Halomonas nitroreducens]|uniref:Pilus assembly protein n=1 Tax=Halomonas nitroreducens TaxID=447425 RepID=A0A3S0HRD6_9GAMM|nr:TadE/TadG family type IV pilus assembly protein [Halomonas nitroreducens]RTQ99640.1 pilus assembly protein [Halomonas nitroreducens]